MTFPDMGAMYESAMSNALRSLEHQRERLDYLDQLKRAVAEQDIAALDRLDPMPQREQRILTRHDDVSNGYSQPDGPARLDPKKIAAKRRDVRRNHARDLGVTVNDLIRLGWTNEAIDTDIVKQYDGRCPGLPDQSCGLPYRDGVNGLRDLSLDIVDPTLAPLYGINTTWICWPCNRRKGRRTPDELRQRAVQAFSTDQQLSIFDALPAAGNALTRVGSA